MEAHFALSSRIDYSQSSMIRSLGPSGEPELKAVTTDDGSLIETYVYTRKPGKDMAVIHLRGGKVEP